jgi:hypothetical protein
VLEDVKSVFRMAPRSTRGQHFGSRLVFDAKGFLYITLGDRGEMQRAQRMDDHAGSVVRLHDDGRVPADNPFVKVAGARPEKFTVGNRNMQGAAIHPVTGELWTHEHGPQGGDELNVMRAGRNYGWPIITYGANYGIGTRIGEGTARAGMEQPLMHWTPSIAPSGMAFYSGSAFPAWKGHLLVGALRGQALHRLELDGEKVVHEERLLQGVARIRDVRVGPDGLVYLLTDERAGRLLRLEPGPRWGAARAGMPISAAGLPGLGRERLHRQRVDLFAHAVAQCLVDHLMLLHLALAGEQRADDHRLEMRAVATDLDELAGHALLDVLLDLFRRDHRGYSFCQNGRRPSSPTISKRCQAADGLARHMP